MICFSWASGLLTSGAVPVVVISALPGNKALLLREIAVYCKGTAEALLLALDDQVLQWIH